MLGQLDLWNVIDLFSFFNYFQSREKQVVVSLRGEDLVQAAAKWPLHLVAVVH